MAPVKDLFAEVGNNRFLVAYKLAYQIGNAYIKRVVKSFRAKAFLQKPQGDLKARRPKNGRPSDVKKLPQSRAWTRFRLPS